MARFRVLQAGIPTRSDRDRMGFSPSDHKTRVIIVCSRAIRCGRAQRRESSGVIYTRDRVRGETLSGVRTADLDAVDAVGSAPLLRPRGRVE